MSPKPRSRTDEMLEQRARASREAVDRAIVAIRHLDATGQAINFARVAKAANVSRSTLYRHAEIRAEIERLASAHRARGPAPDAIRMSEDSKDARIKGLQAENKRLRDEIAALRQEVAAALGALREARR